MNRQRNLQSPNFSHVFWLALPLLLVHLGYNGGVPVCWTSQVAYLLQVFHALQMGEDLAGMVQKVRQDIRYMT